MMFDPVSCVINRSGVRYQGLPLLRASAVAERLRSSMDTNTVAETAPRLWKQRCRMIQRGIAVTPLGPGFC